MGIAICTRSCSLPKGIEEHGILPRADPQHTAFIDEEQRILRPTALFPFLVNVLSRGSQSAEDDAPNQVLEINLALAWHIIPQTLPTDPKL